MADASHQDRASAGFEGLQGKVDVAKHRSGEGPLDYPDDVAAVATSGDWRQELALQQRARKQALLLIIVSAAGTFGVAYGVWVGVTALF